jgi:hypothetical protein
MRAASTEYPCHHTLLSPLVHHVQGSSCPPLFFLFSGLRRKIDFYITSLRAFTYVRGIAHACAVGVAVCKDQTNTLPRMGATYASVIRIAGGDLPPRRHMQRLLAIFNKSANVDCVAMKRHIQVGAVALWERWRGKGLVSLSRCVHAHEQSRKLTSTQLTTPAASTAS